MDDKKIYKILQMWFPALAQRKLPKKDQRHIFNAFLAWMNGHSDDDPNVRYLMTIHHQHYVQNGLELSALLQKQQVNVVETQQRIYQRVQPIIEHFEQHKAMIGRYYNVQDQIFDLVFEEIKQLLATQEMELLLICTQTDYHWIAVPKDAEKIEKFCHSFEKLFKNEQVSIEQYVVWGCARST